MARGGLTCSWCEDPQPDHQHYAVLVREGGKLLGRLTPSGTCTQRKIHAAILSQARATEVAASINSEGNFVATVIPF